MCCCDPDDCLVCSVAIPASLSCLSASVSWKVFWSVMRSDGILAQKIKSWLSGQVRAERFLAEVITIDGRMEWTFGVECVDKMAGDVHITSRRRYTGSISMGSQQSEETGLLARRARVGRKREKLKSLQAENKERRSRIDGHGKEGSEHKSGQVSPVKEEGDSEEVWRDCMEVEDDTECRFASKEVQENLVESLQHQLASRLVKEERSHA